MRLEFLRPYFDDLLVRIMAAMEGVMRFWKASESQIAEQSENCQITRSPSWDDKWRGF
jgi:hypothetical protein